MTHLSNKKKKFIKRNYKQLSTEELARKTGLTPADIQSLIDEYTIKTSGDHQSAPIKKRGFSLSAGKIILLVSLLFAATAFIIYSPSLHGDFIFDDIAIQQTPIIHITSISQLTDLLFSQEAGRKIGFMSFALNYYFGGLNTFGYHLVNVIIHILNGLALFFLSYTLLMLPSPGEQPREYAFMVSLLGSLVWLVHPIQTQAVSYIVQRLTSLSALFFLLSLICYIKGRMSQSRKKFLLFVLCIVSGLLALGTKQNAAMLPLFIILSELLFFQHYPLKMDSKKLFFLILTVGIFIVIAWTYLGSDVITRLALQYEKRGWTPLERVLTQLRVVMFYLSLLIYPHPSRLNLDHDFSLSHSLFSPFTTFLSLLAIIGVLALAIFFIKKNRFVAYALFWFLGNLVIESSIIPLELVFEHRAYLPSMGLIVLAIALCYSLPKKTGQKWVTTFIIPIILLFSYWTYERSSVWADPISLWGDAVQKSPNKARPHDGLGFAYDEKGMLDEAISEYQKALAIKPRYSKAHNDLGVAYTKKGMRNEAILEFKKAIAIEPDYPMAHNNLGAAYTKKGMLDDAITEFKRALAIDSHYLDASNNLGSAYKQKGMLDQAITEFKKVISVNPNYAKAYYNLGTTYARKGEWDAAILEYIHAIDIKPDYAEAHNNLAVAYYSKGNYTLAIVHCDRTIELGHRVNPQLQKLLNPYR